MFNECRKKAIVAVKREEEKVVSDESNVTYMHPLRFLKLNSKTCSYLFSWRVDTGYMYTSWSAI